MQSNENGAPHDSARETRAAIVVALLVAAAVSWWGWRRERSDRDPDAGDSATVSLETPIRLDPDVRTDTLANGLRYYIRENGYPEERAELRLVVDAGSVLEDDDQRGLAHGVEHMAFRGTRRFPARTIDTYLQSVGMRLGDDVNATTSYDETIYRLTIPTGRKAVVDSAIMILADWAHAVTFDAAAARQEGAIVFEEWRTRRTADDRLAASRDSLLYQGSRYADRRVIGDTATLRRFDVAAMRRFYRDWYRPDRMAVIVVGDVDVRATERVIRRQFETIPRAAPGREAPASPSPRGSDDRLVFLADPEAAGSEAHFWFPRAPVPQQTVGDYRRALVERIARSILRGRLESEANRAGSPLLSAAVSVSQRVRPIEAHVVAAKLVEGQTSDGVATLGAAIERLRRFGPNASELAGVKELLLRESRSALATAEESSDIADALADYHLRGDPVPGVTTENQWTSELLGGIGTREVAAFFEQIAPGRARPIVISSPSRRQGVAVDQRVVLAALDSAAARVVNDETDSASVTIMPNMPESGRITSRKSLAKIGVQEWRLSNGMRILLKPTDFEDDAVEMRLMAPGGASLAPREDYASAYLADKLLEVSGAGGLTGAEIARVLDGRSVTVSPTVDDERIEVTGSGRRGDLELMLQLAHLYLTSPREDDAARRRYTERLSAFARNRAADPDAVLADTVAAALRPGDPRALRTAPAFAAAVDMRKAMRFWRERASNGSNFTAVFVGDFEVWQLSPLIERYLGSIPEGHVEQPADFSYTRPQSAEVRSFRRGVEPSATTRIVLGDTLTITPEADVELRETRDLVEAVLHERLREELAGTYGVNVGLEVFLGPRPSFALSIEFSAAPERIDSLAATAVAELERLRTRGPTADEASRVRKMAIEHTGGASQTNGYWASELAWHSLLGWSLESIAQHEGDAKKVSIGMLTSSCARFLDGRRFVRVTRLPDASGDASVAGGKR
ncbi:MAG TPA: insulinase family protein [Gemmatimonadaceae bacterium]|nr:insulinase family protein [Gemmatimonadaceae bacterium]